MTESQSSQNSQLLHALRKLEDNQAWREIVAPKIRGAFERHSAAISDRSFTAEKRAEHLEAYHTAKELHELVPAKIAALGVQLTEWMQAQNVVDSRIADSIGS